MRKIISVNTADQGSGAERVAWTLFKGFQRRGLESWLVVGDKKTADPYVMPFFLSPNINYVPYATPDFQDRLQAQKDRDLAEGVEDYHFPYSKYLPSMTSGAKPDVIFCHNLHGGYFDLRVLAELSHELPVFLYLHDSWLTTGHCAYPVGCERWRTGCGACADLTLPPAVARDATDINWRQKAAIFKRARLHVAAPTRWLLERARQSMLAPAMIDSRVIPCPIDQALFHPAPRAQARQELGLPQDGYLLVSAAFQARSNPYKDYETIEAAMVRLAQLMPDDKILLVVLGEEAPEQHVANTRLRFLGFEAPEVVAKYLQAADVFVHAAKAENFGLITGEAQACGTPVVATAIGGLPEVVRDGERGLLAPPADAEQLALAIRRLLLDAPLRRRLGRQAAQHVDAHWSTNTIVGECLAWFQQGTSRHWFESRIHPRPLSQRASFKNR